jgi:putative oxidoreductase
MGDSMTVLMLGLLLLQHGTTQYLNVPVGRMNNASIQTMSGAAIIELVCGVLLVVGVLTRPAAFLASGMTAVAYSWIHAGRGFFAILIGGELAALYCFAAQSASTESWARNSRRAVVRGILQHAPFVT